jgi:hypothetical protein
MQQVVYDELEMSGPKSCVSRFILRTGTNFNLLSHSNIMLKQTTQNSN